MCDSVAAPSVQHLCACVSSLLITVLLSSSSVFLPLHVQTQPNALWRSYFGKNIASFTHFHAHTRPPKSVESYDAQKFDAGPRPQPVQGSRGLRHRLQQRSQRFELFVTTFVAPTGMKLSFYKGITDPGGTVMLTCKTDSYYETCEWRKEVAQAGERPKSCHFEWKRAHDRVRMTQCSKTLVPR